jgi:hypothetical protein
METGVQLRCNELNLLDSGFRRNDDFDVFNCRVNNVNNFSGANGINGKYSRLSTLRERRFYRIYGVIKRLRSTSGGLQLPT